MKFSAAGSEVWIPDGANEAAALQHVTHVAIGAHQDDVETMALEGILACYRNPEKSFMAVIVTNGAGSPRSGPYADYTDEQMQAVRRTEQKKAAFVGEYSAVAFLNYPSAAVKNSSDSGPKNDLKSVLSEVRPEVIYTHNLADKHDTHIGVALRTIEAIRELPHDKRPAKLYGCQAWRDLDWLMDDDKVIFNVGGHENLAASLIGVFDSQIAGGKRYDLAAPARRRAQATFHQSHSVDAAEMIDFAMDLTPLIQDDRLDPAEYIDRFIRRFAEDVRNKIRKFS